MCLRRIVPQGVNVTQLRALQDGSIGFLPHGGSGSYYETVKEVWETDFAKYWYIVVLYYE